VGGVVTVQPERPRGRPETRQIRGASEQIAVQIQHYIQREGLGPGDFLGREEDLAGEFGVSRPTLREALKLLASGNLIRATKGPGGGIFVAHTADQGMSRSLSDAIEMMLETGAVSLEELLDARVLLEVPLAGLAAYQPDEATVRRLREAVKAEEAAPPDDTQAIAEADAEIHQTIAAAAGNRMVQALTGWIFEVLQPSLIEVLHPAVVQSAVVEQHQVLLSAVEKGDPARAERAMKDHLLYLRDVLAMVQEQPEAPPGADGEPSG
jgi:GntR family transcriptional regulator, transcriptional repressor for pyruvate dehydrogenase complex